MAPYEPNGWDHKLLHELRDWQIKVYKYYWYNNDPFGSGPSLVMSNHTLQQLVDLSHYSYIKQMEDVTGQTGWKDYLGISDEIFDICQCSHLSFPAHHGTLKALIHLPLRHPSRSLTPPLYWPANCQI